MTEFSDDGVEQQQQLTIKSPYPNYIAAFDNPDIHSDLTFAIIVFDKSGDEKKRVEFRVHCLTLSMASPMLTKLLTKKASEFDYVSINGPRIEWKVSSNMRCDILVKWLKFCYGEDQSFKISECPAALDLLSRLQLKESERMEKEITEFIVATAKSDLERGAKLLVECSNIGCDYVDGLARAILTRENLMRNPDIVIDKCLMNLPIKFLDIIQGDEFKDMKNHIVLRYVKFHRDISESEKQRVLKGMVDCCESGQELKELFTQGIITCDEMVEYYLQQWDMTTARLNEQTVKTETALKDLEEQRRRTERAEADLKTQRERIIKAESELITQRYRETKAETEKEKISAEGERMKKEIEENERRLKQMKKEKEEAMREMKQESCTKEAVIRERDKLKSERKAAIKEKESEKKAKDLAVSELEKLRREMERLKPWIERKEEERKKREKEVQEQRKKQCK